MSKALHMESTSISVIKTCSDIEEVLVRHNVTTIMKTFVGGEVTGIQFIYEEDGKKIPIKIPFKWEAIQRLAETGKTGYKKTANPDQAKRVAARLELRWIQSMLAKVEVGMAEMVEIFMPYIMIDDTRTFYDKIKESKFKGLLLTTGEKTI